MIDDSRVIINLASKEYSKCIEKYLTPKDTYITISFCELSGNKLVTKGTYAKMARGEMVRFMAEREIENPEEIRKFDRLGYTFRRDLSSESEYVFERNEQTKILSGAQLKYIAFTSMLIDHVNKALIYPNLNGGILLVISDILTY